MNILINKHKLTGRESKRKEEYKSVREEKVMKSKQRRKKRSVYLLLGSSYSPTYSYSSFYTISHSLLLYQSFSHLLSPFYSLFLSHMETKLLSVSYSHTHTLLTCLSQIIFSSFPSSRFHSLPLLHYLLLSFNFSYKQ